jgi:hypothetical protein
MADGGPATTQCCAACRYFRGAASEIEFLLPGVRTLSSAYAAIRADDGLCGLHDRYLDARSRCAGYSPRATP